MTINPSTDRGSTGRWKYGWVPPTPEQFCEMIQDTAILPDNGTVALPGMTKVLGMNPGECPELVEIPKNRFRTYQPLVVGSNLIVHNLGYSEVMVEVRNDATGELVACRVVNETTTSCELELSMTVAVARITVR